MKILPDEKSKCAKHNKEFTLISVEGKRNSKVYVCSECNKQNQYKGV